MCVPPPPPIFGDPGGNALIDHGCGNRDVDAGLVGDAVGAIRDPEFAIRRKNAERGAGRHARRIPQSGRAQSHPDQHQVRRRRVEPHDRKSSHEVRSHLPYAMRPRVVLTLRGWL
jgi:hypothetical protein